MNLKLTDVKSVRGNTVVLKFDVPLDNCIPVISCKITTLSQT